MEMIQLAAPRNARTERAGNIWSKYGAFYKGEHYVMLRTCVPVEFDETWLPMIEAAGWDIEREEVEVTVIDGIWGTALQVPPDWFDFWAEECVLP
jgi:hypothetical protein